MQVQPPYPKSCDPASLLSSKILSWLLGPSDLRGCSLMTASEGQPCVQISPCTPPMGPLPRW